MPKSTQKAQPTTVVSSSAAREVRHALQFKNELIKLSDAAVGVLLIRTREPYRAQEVIHEVCIDQAMDFRVWTILTGFQQFPVPKAGDPASADMDLSKATSKDDKYDPVGAFDMLAEYPKDGMFVFMNPQFAFEMPGFQQHIKAHVRTALDCRQRVILLVPEGVDIPPAIENDINVIDFKTPSHIELREIWDNMLNNIEEENHPRFDESDVDQVVQNSLGMSHHEFDTALAIAFVELRERLVEDLASIKPQDFIDVIMRTKVEVIRKTNILSRMEKVDIDTIGGLDVLKDYLIKRVPAFGDDARAAGVDVPRGILLVGPPGGGKSLIAKAVAGVFGIECINFDIGKVFGQYVGQSEQRMDVALKLIDAVAPCVLLMDEIDKGLGGIGSSGDSGTTSRVFGKFLTWMQERDVTASPVFVIMTANNIVGMPPELMRKGRVNEIFAVTFPSEKERADILRIHLKKRGHADDVSDKDLRRVAESTKDFVGAELEAVVSDALTEAFFEDGSACTVTAERMIAVAEKIIPLSKAKADQVLAMNKWAKDNARAASSGMSFEAEPLPEGAEPPPASRTIKRGLGIRRRPTNTGD